MTLTVSSKPSRLCKKQEKEPRKRGSFFCNNEMARERPKGFPRGEAVRNPGFLTDEDCGRSSFINVFVTGLTRTGTAGFPHPSRLRRATFPQGKAFQISPKSIFHSRTFLTALFRVSMSMRPSSTAASTASYCTVYSVEHNKSFPARTASTAASPAP